MKEIWMAMKRFHREIGNPGEQRIAQAANASLLADRSVVSRASYGDSGEYGHLPGRAALSNACLISFLSLVVLALSGCTSTTARLGAFTFYDVSTNPPTVLTQQPASVTASSTSLGVSVAIAGTGPNLGLDWRLACGGSPNTTIEPQSAACGSLNPVHVGGIGVMNYVAPMYVPVGDTVTLTATVTSDPSITASVTLTIVPQPVTIAFTLGQLPPATGCPTGVSYCMAASTNVPNTVPLGATVSNDPTEVGVIWSCAPTGACGSFNSGNPNPAQMPSGGNGIPYTAPATVLGSIPASGFPVTVTATPACETDFVAPCQSKTSISETITMMPVAVAATVEPGTVGAGVGAANLTATVTWDNSGAGVTWPATISCSAGSGAQACGAIGSSTCGTGVAPTYVYTCTAAYTPPQSLPSGVTSLTIPLTATSAADSTRSGSVAVTIGPPPPIGVSVAGPSGSTQMESQVDGETLLIAAVTNDFSNNGSGSGVNWSLPSSSSCGSGLCGSISAAACPASVTPAANAALFCATYMAPGSVPATNPVTVTATSVYCSNTPGSSQCAGNTPVAGSAAVTIIPPITVAITPPASLTAGVAGSFTATVSGDSSNAGVDWSCGAANSKCGGFGSTQGNSSPANPFHSASGVPVWFTSPVKSMAISVTITATSTASESIPPLVPDPVLQPGQGVSDPVSVAITPVPYVHFVPFAPSQLPASPSQSGPAYSLIAAVANDSSNAGVDWSVCSSVSTCGQFLVSAALPPTLTNPLGAAPVYSPTVHVASGQAVSYQPPTTPNGTVTVTATSTSTPSANASQSMTITANFSSVSIQGMVMTGNLPVGAASVFLYEAGSSGYGSAMTASLTPLTLSNGSYSVATGSGGGFTIPAGYTCDNPNSLLYLVARGGTASGLGSPNGQLGMMTALGPCGNLNASVPIVVNEVTTVATAWALAPFTGTCGTNFQNEACIGSSGSNYSNGLANAFAAVNNLVDITTGQALEFTPGGGFFTPAGGSSVVYNGAVPEAEINTLADAIDTCAATTGGQPGDGSACDAFFQSSNVNPMPAGSQPSSNNSPSSVLSAVLEVAKYPNAMGINYWNLQPPIETGMVLYYLVSNVAASGGTPPFQPILAEPPSDWTIALSFTGGGLEGIKTAGPGSKAMGIDGLGNLWIANNGPSSVTEFSDLGVALSPYATGSTRATAGGFKGAGINKPEKIAIDPYGDAWVLNKADNSLSEGSAACISATSSNPFCGSSSFPYAGFSGNGAVDMAIDATGNVWVADNDNSGTGGDVAEYAGYNSCTGGMACTSSGTQLASGAPIGDFTGLTDNTVQNPDLLDTQPANPQTIAIDSKENVWILDLGNYAAVVLSGANGSLELVDHGNTNAPNSGLLPSDLLNSNEWGVSMAIDKSGDVFIPDSAYGLQLYELDSYEGCAVSNTCGYAQLPISLYLVGSSGVLPPIAIDGSGNIWIVANAYAPASGSDPVSLAKINSSGKYLNQNNSWGDASTRTSTMGFGYVGSTYAITTGPDSNVAYDSATSWNPAPIGIATDASGNLWLLSGGASTQMWEFIGVATPVVTPLSLGKPATTP